MNPTNSTTRKGGWNADGAQDWVLAPKSFAPFRIDGGAFPKKRKKRQKAPFLRGVQTTYRSSDAPVQPLTEPNHVTCVGRCRQTENLSSLVSKLVHFCGLGLIQDGISPQPFHGPIVPSMPFFGIALMVFDAGQNEPIGGGSSLAQLDRPVERFDWRPPSCRRDNERRPVCSRRRTARAPTRRPYAPIGRPRSASPARAGGRRTSAHARLLNGPTSWMRKQC